MRPSKANAFQRDGLLRPGLRALTAQRAQRCAQRCALSLAALKPSRPFPPSPIPPFPPSPIPPFPHSPLPPFPHSPLPPFPPSPIPPFPHSPLPPFPPSPLPSALQLLAFHPFPFPSPLTPFLFPPSPPPLLFPSPLLLHSLFAALEPQAPHRSAYPPFPSPCSHPLPSPLPLSPPPYPRPPPPPPAWQLWSRASTWAFILPLLSLPSPTSSPALPPRASPPPPHPSPLSPSPFPLPPSSLAAVEPSIHPGSCGAENPPWQLWSRAATWAFMGGKVPGIGASVGANVTIPCGRAVLLDVPRVSLGLLIVKGWLRLLDKPFVPSISVQARFIIVYGRLSVGTEKHHFRSQATFTLIPNLRFGRSEFLLRQPAPADPAHPRSLGHKAFVVVGGQVDFHGMPGGGSTPAWVRLAQRANKGARQITVDADVSAWPRGGVIALASTTPDLNNAEKAIITGVRRTGPSSSVITLHRPLKHSHDGERNAVRDGFGGSVDVRAEVALLTRNIVVQGVHEQPPYQYDVSGGMVDVGAKVALLTRNVVIQGVHCTSSLLTSMMAIHGVQFKGVGIQAGSLGRYPVFLSLCQPVPFSSQVPISWSTCLTRPRPFTACSSRGWGCKAGSLGRYPVHLHVCVSYFPTHIPLPPLPPPPGGHFMVYMTRTPQTIHGVQFKGLVGRAGQLGQFLPPSPLPLLTQAVTL
ncbi:unnamed protein product [Closterium sp. Naga37s-1]|nr:unnamed protein product [Closterium sp. Naga37s-1]